MVERSRPLASPRELNNQQQTLAGFHPAIREWFAQRFPEGPTEPQARGWTLIARGRDTLIAAPTGSGKTLAGFLVAIDSLYRAHAAGQDVSGVTRVVYVSPLKALAVDIAQNLERPLAEIASKAVELGLQPAPISVAVRTGDTSASQRARMLRLRPSLVVTTPESLYLLLTSARGREALGTVETVIVDEIHAVARDKRGAHLALSLERLEALCQRRPVRIGLSATQRPIEMIGRLLVGDRPPPAVVDVGHRRDLDLALELPDGELEAVASAEQLGDVLNRIAELVDQHRTTLVFVNTRNLAERVAHRLGESLGGEVVSAHHGSLSRERRQRVEARLRAGELKALVATASLEPAGGGVPGQHHRSDRHLRSPARPPDDRRYPPRSPRHRRLPRLARADRGRPGPLPLPRYHRAVGPGARDHHRPAIRLPRRRGGAEPAHQCGAAAAWPAHGAGDDWCAGPGRHRAGARRDHAGSGNGRRSARPAVLDRRAASAPGVVRLVVGAG